MGHNRSRADYSIRADTHPWQDGSPCTDERTISHIHTPA